MFLLNYQKFESYMYRLIDKYKEKEGTVSTLRALLDYALYKEDEDEKEYLLDQLVKDIEKPEQVRLKKNLDALPYREKIEGLVDLERRRLVIIQEDVQTVHHNLRQVLEEKGLTVADLSKLAGISRQSLNSIVNKHINPGIEFVLKISYILDKPVEELFQLTDASWVSPYVEKQSTPMYVDVSRMYLLDNEARKQQIEVDGAEYIHKRTGELLSSDNYKSQLEGYIERAKEEGSKENKKTLTELFNLNITPIYQRVGEVINPYKIP